MMQRQQPAASSLPVNTTASAYRCHQGRIYGLESEGDVWWRGCADRAYKRVWEKSPQVGSMTKADQWANSLKLRILSSCSPIPATKH